MMKKLVWILFVFVYVGAFAQTKKQSADSTRIVMYSGNRYSKNKPLVIVDSKVYQDSLSQVNPNTIERIDILKDSIAITKYGKAGKNGVILITTKIKTPKTTLVRLDGSFARKSFPFYVVDGMGFQEKPKRLDPKKIIDVSVMQAPEAVKAYGEKAKDGAIIITTKKKE